MTCPKPVLKAAVIREAYLYLRRKERRLARKRVYAGICSRSIRADLRGREVHYYKPRPPSSAPQPPQLITVTIPPTCRSLVETLQCELGKLLSAQSTEAHHPGLLAEQGFGDLLEDLELRILKLRHWLAVLESG